MYAKSRLSLRLTTELMGLPAQRSVPKSVWQTASGSGLGRTGTRSAGCRFLSCVSVGVHTQACELLAGGHWFQRDERR